MCLYPRLIKNRKYQPNKKNGGNAPVCVDKRVMAVPVKCGNCIECCKAKAREWRVRLSEEVRTTKLKAYFVTLTFTTESLIDLGYALKETGYERDNKIARIAVKRFRERWRKEHKKSVRKWFITELGGGRYEHLHIHGIVFTEKPKEEIEKHWQYGGVYYGKYVNETTVNYVVKYMHKKDTLHMNYKPVILTSAGMGAEYLKRADALRNGYLGDGTNETYINRKGVKTALPIYYRNKIYSEEEREKLWLMKLDKEERYVMGEKIDISISEANYRKAVKIARRTSKRLGYGDNKRADKEYEEARRELLWKERTEKENAAEQPRELHKNDAT